MSSKIHTVVTPGLDFCSTLTLYFLKAKILIPTLILNFLHILHKIFESREFEWSIYFQLFTPSPNSNLSFSTPMHSDSRQNIESLDSDSASLISTGFRKHQNNRTVNWNTLLACFESKPLFAWKMTKIRSVFTIMEAYIMVGPIDRKSRANVQESVVGCDWSTKLFRKHKIEPIRTKEQDSYKITIFTSKNSKWNDHTWMIPMKVFFVRTK